MMNEHRGRDQSQAAEASAGAHECAKPGLFLPESDEKQGDHYVLECWKVKPGSLVRNGETVALACLTATYSKMVSASTGTSTKANAADSNPSVPTKHKRPTTRRRWPGAAATDATSSSLSSDGTNTGLDKREGESTGRKKLPQSIPIIAPVSGFVRLVSNVDMPMKIGYIEPCSHPAVYDGLCCVCGDIMAQKSPAINHSGYSDSLSPARAVTQVTVSGGLTFTVTEREGLQMAKQNAGRLTQRKRLSLVLDLDHVGHDCYHCDVLFNRSIRADTGPKPCLFCLSVQCQLPSSTDLISLTPPLFFLQTLVHATADIRARKHLESREDVRSLLLPMTEEAKVGHLWMQHFVKLRPNVKEFLESVMPLYEIGVYTAGTRQYAEQIATVLCRHLVGAKMDQIDLDQLRFKVARAEANLHSRTAGQTKEEIRKMNKPRDNGEVGVNLDKKEKGGDVGEDSPPQKKRKVAFAVEPSEVKPSSWKHQQIIDEQQDVAKLKSDLDEAMRLEKLATETRQRLFGSRIVSRSDVGDLGRDVKSLKRIFPCGGTMAAVVDDREDVWANAKDNNHSLRNHAGSRPGEPVGLIKKNHCC